ncbi:TetR/AcrR family transcriptional regulator [Nocardioides sp. YIM 152315]|uniref:TetR/AcrR family transcriptional regulator n=1 Tax=Nocardioides sp. YIM 152315 TaxID=3031760 RepID=UPI0023DA2B84|nr:TetR/AcrR family transcriptional regulator [Nocardioides sp. YIM 152315]MDF1604702.1 TetR/AcrR family transcriptional regulator [Nocardioides sp. YIM 152315]
MPAHSGTRRTGPRSDVDVRTLVLDTAERLFAEHGHGAVSIRQLARDADVAPTAVAYHFDDRDGVLRAVLVRRGQEAMLRVHARLADVVGAPGTPTANDLVRALLDPYLELLARSPVGGLRWLKLMYVLATSDHPVWRQAVSSDAELPGLYRGAFARVLPDVPADAVPRLANLTVYSMLGVLARADQPGFGSPWTPGAGVDEEFVDLVVRFGSAGLLGALEAT